MDIIFALLGIGLFDPSLYQDRATSHPTQLISCTEGQDPSGAAAYIAEYRMLDGTKTKYIPLSEGKCPDRLLYE